MTIEKNNNVLSSIFSKVFISIIIFTFSSLSHADKPKLITIDYAYYNPVSLLMKDRGSLEKEFEKDNIKIRWVLSLGSNKALDSFTKANLHEHVKHLWSSLKITIIMVTHDISQATTMSDRILILKKSDQNKIKNQEIVKIDQQRTSFSKDKYNEAIKNSIFNSNYTESY